MTYSCILRDKDNQKIVRVSFEKEAPEGEGIAEAILPGGAIEKSEGFSKEELEQLHTYLLDAEEEIWAKAKEISDPMKWL